MVRPTEEKLAVFGYGSLVSRASVSETLGRAAPRPMPARLRGWRRRWSVYRDNTAHEKAFERVDGKPFRHVVGLNIERAPGVPEAGWPNGALVELAEAELDRLDRREVRYERIEIEPEDIITARPHGFGRVFAYTAKAAHLATQTPPEAIIIAAYVRACEAAFGELGPGEWQAFMATTGEMPAPVVEARLLRDQVPPGNPRAW